MRLIGGQADYDFEPTPFFPVFGATAEPIPSLRFPPPAFGEFPGTIGGVVAVDAIRPIAWPDAGDHEASAWGALVGYRIVRYAAIELSYLDLGSLERTESFAGGIILPFLTTFEHELETSGPAVSALGILPIGKSFEIYARAGVLFADSELSTRVVESTVPVFAGDSSITFGSRSLLWGAGAQFNWREHWSVRLDFQRFEGVGEDSGPGEADIDLLSLAVLFRL